MLIVRYAIARKCLAFSFPWRSIIKYALASAAMTMVLLVIPHPTKLSQVVALTLLGAATYLAVVTLIDKETKSLLDSIIREMRARAILWPKLFRKPLNEEENAGTE